MTTTELIQQTCAAITAVLALAEQATPGRWDANTSPNGGHTAGPVYVITDSPSRDAAFIAATDPPWAKARCAHDLDLLARLEKRILPDGHPDYKKYAAAQTLHDAAVEDLRALAASWSAA